MEIICTKESNQLKGHVSRTITMQVQTKQMQYYFDAQGLKYAI